MQGATAEQIAMDFAVTLNAEQVSKSRMTSEVGVEAVVQIDDVLKISLTPSITAKGDIRIKADIYLFRMANTSCSQSLPSWLWMVSRERSEWVVVKISSSSLI